MTLTKDKSGFTLIELLAVIVILAVIALIATPIIMNVINDAKKGAAKDSMYSYVKAVELATTRLLQPDTKITSGNYITDNNGDIYNGATKLLTVDMKGTRPENKKGYININNGRVAAAELIFDGVIIMYDGNNSVVKDELSKVYSIGDVVYFDPTGAVTDCKASKEWTISNTSTTCYKWNVIKDNGNSIEMLLDHNLGNKVAWNSSNKNINGPLEAYNQLKAETTNWSKVESLTSNDNVTRNGSNETTYSINYNGMRARLISGQEVADIGNDTVWTPSNISGVKYSSKSWLYQNLSTLNTNLQPYAYWTDTATPYVITSAWFVIYSDSGTLSTTDAYRTDNLGIRPVARVLKSNI